MTVLVGRILFSLRPESMESEGEVEVLRDFDPRHDGLGSSDVPRVQYHQVASSHPNRILQEGESPESARLADE